MNDIDRGFPRTKLTLIEILISGEVSLNIETGSTGYHRCNSYELTIKEETVSFRGISMLTASFIFFDLLRNFHAVFGG